MFLKKILLFIRNKFLSLDITRGINRRYYKRFKKHSFRGKKLKTRNQYEAVIIKMYHGIEKGLSYENYKPGFGKNAVCDLITVLEEYSQKYDVEDFCYKTALSALNEYVRKNREHGHTAPETEKKIASLPGTENGFGGTVEVRPIPTEELESLNFESFIKSRHSIRHFSQERVDEQLLRKAVELAQHTPSACNRQGWRTRIVCDKAVVEEIFKNQNGNRGFGQEIDKLIFISFDINCFGRSREHYQGFIDGGMFAMNVLHSLHYYGIASVPLSASLTPVQENNLRKILSLPENEMPVIFIGVGAYPELTLTTRSERKDADIKTI